MTVRAIEHVQLAMPPGGEERARSFYRDLLGIPEIRKPPHLAVRGGCWFEEGGLKIHLGVDHDFHPAKKAHPGLLVDGLPELAARLFQAGYRVSEDDGVPGFRRALIYDPFGNRIELMEHKPG